VPSGPRQQLAPSVRAKLARNGNREAAQMTNGHISARRWLLANGDSVYLTIAGLLLLADSWGAILKRSDPAAASLAILAGGAFLIAPFANRLHGTLRVGPVEMHLRARVIAAVKGASRESLEGVLPLLESGDVTVERVSLPPSLAGHALTEPELAFIRKDLKLSVIAVQMPGEHRWRAGGEISDEMLPLGSTLLIAGPPDALMRFQQHSGLTC
jgi:hypothetical protein